MSDVPSYIPGISADGQLAPGLAASIVRDVLGLGSRQNHQMEEAHLYDAVESLYGRIRLHDQEYEFLNHANQLATVSAGAVNVTGTGSFASGLLVGGVNVLRGSLGATANRVLTTSGITGHTAQSVPVTIDGSGNVNTSGAIEASGVASFGNLIRSSNGNGILLATNGSYVAGTRIQNLGVDGKLRVANFAATGGGYIDTTVADTFRFRNLADNGFGQVEANSFGAVSAVSAGAVALHNQGWVMPRGVVIAADWGGGVFFTRGISIFNTIDTMVSSPSAGLVEINNGTPGTLRDVSARNYSASGLITLGAAIGTPSASERLRINRGSSGSGSFVIRLVEGSAGSDRFTVDGEGVIRCGGIFNVFTGDSLTLSSAGGATGVRTPFFVGGTNRVIQAENGDFPLTVNAATLNASGLLQIGSTFTGLGSVRINDNNNAGGISIRGTTNPGVTLYTSDGTLRGIFPALVTQANAYFTGSAANDLVLRSDTAGSRILLGVTGAGLTMAVGLNAVSVTGSLTTSGQIVNQPRSVVSLTNNGQLEVEATSNTQLTFRFRGSDGVTRSASLTLS